MSEIIDWEIAAFCKIQRQAVFGSKKITKDFCGIFENEYIGTNEWVLSLIQS